MDFFKEFISSVHLRWHKRAVLQGLGGRFQKIDGPSSRPNAIGTEFGDPFSRAGPLLAVHAKSP